MPHVIINTQRHITDISHSSYTSQQQKNRIAFVVVQNAYV